MFLDEAQRDAQNYHDGDHDRGPLIAEEVRRSRKREQEQVQRVDRAADELTEDRMVCLLSNLIRSDRAEPLLDLIGRKPARDAGKSLQGLIGRKASDVAQNLSARRRPFG